jgi:hypothetical protein
MLFDFVEIEAPPAANEDAGDRPLARKSTDVAGGKT